MPSSMDAQALEATGWTALQGSGFTSQLGSIWIRGDAGSRSIGFIATPQHTNNHADSVHGGALMTFADIALGFGAADALGAKHLVTAQLQTHFVAGSRVGDFIHCAPELVRCSAQLIFMRGLLRAGDKTVAACDGIWKVLEPRVGN
jgi:acyl-coenzyme A thioesterase PaaI-like protein